MFKTIIIIIMILLAPGKGGAQRPRVVLDPGHGGRDSGAVGPLGIREKDVALDIALECLRLNRDLFADSLELYLTRYGDTLISLRDRGRLAKGLRADALVSIHCNQAPDPRAQGFEIFLHRKNDPRTAPGILALGLADSLGSHLQGRLGIKARGIKWADFQVLRDTHGQLPAILLETGFLSNGTEAEYSSRATGKTALALALVESLIEILYDE